MFLPRVARSATGQRAFAAISSSSPPTVGTVRPYQVFDRKTKRFQKNRAATRDGGVRSTTVDYIRDEVADRMMERFLVCFRAYRNQDHASQPVPINLGY
jgi:NADH dehydrogenase [ubiquinone] 1 alpha subcomplex assembly factor 5